MIPNQECRHVPAKKGADFLTQLYPEMGGQVRVTCLKRYDNYADGQVMVDLAVDENGLWAIMAMKASSEQHL